MNEPVYLKDSAYARDGRVEETSVDWVHGNSWAVWDGNQWFYVDHVRHMSIFRVRNNDDVKVSEHSEADLDLDGVFQSLIGPPR